jgi:hypothetical protein
VNAPVAEKDDRPNVLWSYHLWQDRDMDGMLEQYPVRPRLFMDSGAFTAWSQAAEVDLDLYLAFLARWEGRFEVIASLDVIGDAEASCANWERMQAEGYDTLPVFHYGEPWEFLDRYCEGSDYVALGGMVGGSTGALMRWGIQALKVCRRYGVRTHGFGVTNMSTFRLPWYSLDSSSWTQGIRWGNVTVWSGTRLQKIEFGDRKLVHRHAGFIRQYGGDPNEVIDGSMHYRDIARVSGAAWAIRDTHTQSRIYLADVNQTSTVEGGIGWTQAKQGEHR